MKKSEMEALIEETVLSTLGTDPDTGEVLIPTQGYLGSKILSVVEEAGMLPPFNLDIFLKSRDKNGIELATGNEWDPE